MQSGQTNSDLDRFLPPGVEGRLLGAMARVGGAVILVLALAVWLSLVTWSVTDPSLSHATGGQITNALGRPGAIVSDLLLQLIGFGAVMLLMAPILWALELIGTQRVDGIRLRAILFPLSILLAAGALSCLPVPQAWPLHHGLGGILGDLVRDAATMLLSFAGPSRAGLLAGIALFGGAFYATLVSAGVTASEFQRFVTLRTGSTERGSSWHQGLKAEAERLAGLSRAPTGTATGYRQDQPAKARVEHSADDDSDLDETDEEIDEETRETRGFLERLFGRSGPANGNDGHAEPMDPVREPELPTPKLSETGFAGRSSAAAPVETGLAKQRPIAWQFAKHFDRLSMLKPGSREGDDEVGAETEVPLEFGLAQGVDANVPGEVPLSHRNRASKEPRAVPLHEAAVSEGDAPTASLGNAASGRLERPSLSLLKRSHAKPATTDLSDAALRQRSAELSEVLADYGIKGVIRDIRPGPVVTLFELEPVRGTKSQRVISLAEDIARSLSATSVRAAVVPGRNAIGFELPNARRESVLLRDMLESPGFLQSTAALPLALGMSIGGEPIIADLAKMPHLLVAGTTGSGKSVGINAMVLSLLYRNAPETCRFIMIDPKMLELSVYNGIPHLLTPVVTDPHKAVAALNWAVGEMEARYKRMAALSVRNIEAFNQRVISARQRGEPLTRTVQTGFDRRSGAPVYEHQEIDATPMPYIVIVADEFADLMIVAGKEIEHAIQRLAQMARAAGIHLIMATQRPSVDVVTGTIKANFPNRISFKVASKIDSRTILNETGAEQLLGQGDMLWSAGAGQLHRVHGPFVSDEEVEAVSRHLARQRAPEFVDGITDLPDDGDLDTEGAAPAARAASEDLYDRAVEIVLAERKASTSFLQRRLSIGYNRAADLIERMEREGLVSPASSTGRRDVLPEGSGSS